MTSLTSHFLLFPLLFLPSDFCCFNHGRPPFLRDSLNRACPFHPCKEASPMRRTDLRIPCRWQSLFRPYVCPGTERRVRPDVACPASTSSFVTDARYWDCGRCGGKLKRRERGVDEFRYRRPQGNPDQVDMSHFWSKMGLNQGWCLPKSRSTE